VQAECARQEEQVCGSGCGCGCGCGGVGVGGGGGVVALVNGVVSVDVMATLCENAS
jgi:hypothetical protein